MTGISEILRQMIEYSEGNLHDINHFLKVWSYARIIGELEELDKNTQYILEVAAITHDIACPMCREKYGSTKAEYQEKEGVLLVEEFLKSTELTKEQVERVIYLVGHHHTLSEIDGLDYQILVEADYLVNADESKFSMDNIKNFCGKVFKTKSGIELLESIYLGK